MNPVNNSSPPAAAGPGGDTDAVYRARAVQAAEKFEAFFISDMLRQMRRSTQALADEDSALNSRTHQDMMDLTDTLMGDTLAGQRAFGIADAILRQLLPAPAFKVSAAPVATAVDTPSHVQEIQP